MKLRLDVDDEIPLVSGNHNQMQQVLMNLMINAQQAMNGEDGAVCVTTRVAEPDPRRVGGGSPPQQCREHGSSRRQADEERHQHQRKGVDRAAHEWSLEKVGLLVYECHES